jgi:RNA polymerase sigma factor (sigma-70 family)
MQHHHVSALAAGVPTGGRRSCRAPSSELERLLLAAAAGDASAWDSLVSRFTPRIRAVARAHRLGAHDTEDVVQTTWLKLFRHIGSVRDPEKLGAWLTTTARRESLRVLGAPSVAAADVDGRADPFMEPECPVEAAERRAALDGALHRLTERQRRLVRLLLSDEEPSYAEIGRALAMPIGSIGPTRARGLALLRADEDLRSVLGFAL